MTIKACKTCIYCKPATDPKAALSYVQCVAPIELPPLPTNGSQCGIFSRALADARRESANWTTINHLNGEIPGVEPAGTNCPLWQGEAA